MTLGFGCYVARIVRTKRSCLGDDLTMNIQIVGKIGCSGEFSRCGSSVAVDEQSGRKSLASAYWSSRYRGRQESDSSQWGSAEKLKIFTLTGTVGCQKAVRVVDWTRLMCTSDSELDTKIGLGANIYICIRRIGPESAVMDQKSVMSCSSLSHCSSSRTKGIQRGSLCFLQINHEAIQAIHRLQ